VKFVLFFRQGNYKFFFDFSAKYFENRKRNSNIKIPTSGSEDMNIDIKE